MLHRIPIPARLAAGLAATLLALATAAWSAPADDLRDAQKLYNQGKVQPALEKVDTFLRAQPKDPQGRFLKGLLLTEQKRTNEAIQVFTGLTEDFPELPEPYNNLAVLYASQGNYEKAKAALELAIHTHPTYATAHENLGDIYAQLASRAYDRALQLDKNNTTAQVKLALVKELFTSQKSGGGQRPSVAKAETPKPEPAKAPAPKAESAKAQAPKSEPKAQPQAQAPKPELAKAAPPAASVQPTNSSAGASGGDARAEVTAALEGWAHAWSTKDVKGYLAHYAPDFEVPGSESRAAWEKQRAERIRKPKSIEVGVKVLSVHANGNEATATIRQSYRSDALKSSTTKTMKLVKTGERWLIKQERVGG